MLVLVLIGLIYVLAGATWGVYQKNRLAKEQRDVAAEELEGLEARRAELAEDIDKLGTERGLEEEIRTKFQVSRPGEQTVVLIEDEEEGAEEGGEGGGGSIWQSIKNWFGFE